LHDAGAGETEDREVYMSWNMNLMRTYVFALESHPPLLSKQLKEFSFFSEKLLFPCSSPQSIYTRYKFGICYVMVQYCWIKERLESVHRSESITKDDKGPVLN
jgi:hypothetical protein